MATARRSATDSVADRLHHEPERFALFQAVRLLEQAARVGAAAPPSADRPVGQDARPDSEVVRFRAATGLAFPAGELQRIALAPDQEPAEGDEALTQTAIRRRVGPQQPELSVNLMGLTGPSGVLPQGYSEILVRALRERSGAMRDFFDMFNHRAIALFYRAWVKYRMPFSFERHGGRGDDGVTQFLAGLVGLGHGRARRRHAAADEAFFHYAGLYAHWPRSVSGLEAMLTDYLDRPVVADQFCGQWLKLPAEVQTRLAGPGSPVESNCQLGVSAMAGSRAWDVQGTIRLRIGPVRGRLFEDLLPGGTAFARLRDLVRMYLGLEYACRLQLTVARDEAPPAALDGRTRLGLNGWLIAHAPKADLKDAEFALV
ncbi:MAG: type VI secretion system baseplate subunit TssG [Alphaproteobacteria bacterium]